MTSIQVQYWELQERKRNNQATLDENKRHNQEMEEQGRTKISNDYELGNRNLDLGYLNSDRNYELGWENAQIGWSNSSNNYTIGMGNLEENRKHNTVMEGIAAGNSNKSGISYGIYGSQRAGDALSNTVSQGKTISGLLTSGIDWIKGKLSGIKYTDQTDKFAKNPLG